MICLSNDIINIGSDNMNERINYILNSLSKSNFRNSFHLKDKDITYIKVKGLDVIKKHSFDFVEKRLSGANISNDGKQTPMQGHPVFVAQHATATCCRECLYKWHKIPKNTQLTLKQKEYIVNVIMYWIQNEINLVKNILKKI